MRVFLTGQNGYIGAKMHPMLVAAGHEVQCADSYFFRGCTFGANGLPGDPEPRDIRDIEAGDLEGADAVIHLAALSNDPLGDLNPNCTHEINRDASIALARAAKEAGVPRFLFSSSCSLYGAAGDEHVTETAAFNPVTPYGRTKIEAEQGIAELADDAFSPTFLRNATAYGVSPQLRLDIVVNNLVGHAVTSGEVRIMSDGTPWRPLVHVEDICRAFLCVLDAPRDAVHNEAFNVGSTAENYQVKDIAEAVRQVVPGSVVTLGSDASPDTRCYKVSCDKITERLGYATKWTVPMGAEELYRAYVEHGLTAEQFTSSRYLRIKRIRELLAEESLDGDLRWSGHDG